MPPNGRGTAGIGIAAAVLALTLAGGAPASGGDPLRDLQYGLDHVRAEAAWEISTGRHSIVAVIDDGVMADHPDLAGQVLTGTAFVDCPESPEGCGASGPVTGTHGTFIAGIIAAALGNGEGIAGVAPDARILPVRADLSRDDVFAATRWAIANGADVINMSFGSPIPLLHFTNDHTDYREVLDLAAAHDVVIVVAAGNAVALPCHDPAFYRGAVCVVATGAAEEPASYSHLAIHESDAVLAAPGGSGGPGSLGVSGSTGTSLGCEVDIVSTVAATGVENYCPDALAGYGFGAGTSFAAPHVAGVAALLASQCRTADEIIDVLMSSARNPLTGARGEWDPAYGHGIVDAAAAVATPVEDVRTTRRPGRTWDHCVDPPDEAPAGERGARAPG